MNGGLITVDGDVRLVGEDMQGGEIHLLGDYGRIFRSAKGTIYHKGKVIHEG